MDEESERNGIKFANMGNGMKSIISKLAEKKGVLEKNELSFAHIWFDDPLRHLSQKNDWCLCFVYISLFSAVSKFCDI